MRLSNRCIHSFSTQFLILHSQFSILNSQFLVDPISRRRSIRVESGRTRAGSRCWRNRGPDIRIYARRCIRGGSRRCRWGWRCGWACDGSWGRCRGRRSQIRVQIRVYVVVSVEICGGVKIEIRIERKIRIHIEVLIYRISIYVDIEISRLVATHEKEQNGDQTQHSDCSKNG